MSRQTRSRAIAAARKKKKEANKPDYKTRSAWVGSGPTIKDKTLKKQYSYDGGKTWSTSKDRPKRTVKKGMSNIPAKEGKQNNPDFGKESEINKNKLKEKTSKKNGSSSSSSEIESDANYAKENKDFNDATSGARTKRLAKDKAAKATSDKEWLQKTRNSPAARAGIGDKQRLAARERHQKFKADRAKAKADRKAGVKKKRKLKITTWRDVE